jgi:hypothetical protein
MANPANTHQGLAFCKWGIMVSSSLRSLRKKTMASKSISMANNSFLGARRKKELDRLLKVAGMLGLLLL